MVEHARQRTGGFDEHGFIQDSDGAVDQVFGYQFEELNEQYISLLLRALGPCHISDSRQDSILLTIRAPWRCGGWRLNGSNSCVAFFVWP